MEYKINGESMFPLLRSNVQIQLQAIEISKVRLGDMIAYYNKNSHEMIVHRVVKKNKQGLIVKGDNNWKRDEIKIKESKLLIVRNIRTNNKNININTIYGKFLNMTLLLLSVLRLIPLFNKRQFVKKVKINDQEVSKKVYDKYMKLLKNKKDK